MTIANLSHDQKLGLVALLEAVAMANREISEGEQKEIAMVATALGDEEYRKLIGEVETRFDGLDSLKEFLKTIEDKPARDLIFGTVWEESTADPLIKETESDLLDWLAKTWDIPRAG